MTEHIIMSGNNVTGDDDEFSLFDLLLTLAKHKKLILGLPFVVAVLVAGISLLMPNIYTSTTKIMPLPQGQAGASAILAQLGGLAGLAGGVAGIKNPNDLYIGMLRSRTLADNMIQRFGLMQSYKAQLPSLVRQRLAGATNITSGKDGIITIEVDDEDPKRAAELANAYVDELFKLTRVLAVTEASQRRLFFEHQYEQARDNLTKAEAAARQAIGKGGLVQVESQGRTIVETNARLRGQITVKEVQIGAMRSFATERNSDLRLAQKELEALRHELSKMEGTSSRKSDDSQEKSGIDIDSLRLLRNVKYYEAIFELLAKQYELAKLEEAKDSTVVQVLDKAIEPDRKSQPKRAVIVLVSTLAAFLVASLGALIVDMFAKARNDPRQATRLQTLKRHLSFRYLIRYKAQQAHAVSH